MKDGGGKMEVGRLSEVGRHWSSSCHWLGFQFHDQCISSCRCFGRPGPRTVPVRSPDLRAQRVRNLATPIGMAKCCDRGPSAVVRLRGRWARAVQVRFRAVKHRAVSNRNCVAARRGGEQRNENDQSVTQASSVGVAVNSIRSAWTGEPSTERRSRSAGDRRGAESSVRRAVPGRRADGWRQKGRWVQRGNQGAPSGTSGVQGARARRAARRESERP
jgi:hypothetical protein